jgi:hypothetical protein
MSPQDLIAHDRAASLDLFFDRNGSSSAVDYRLIRLHWIGPGKSRGSHSRREDQTDHRWCFADPTINLFARSHGILRSCVDPTDTEGKSVAGRGCVTEHTPGHKLFVSRGWRLATEGRLARRQSAAMHSSTAERTEMLCLQPPRDISTLPGGVSLEVSKVFGCPRSRPMRGHS